VQLQYCAIVNTTITDPGIWLNQKGSIMVWHDGYSDPRSQQGAG
jgi:hypothetical protein